MTASRDHSDHRPDRTGSPESPASGDAADLGVPADFAPDGPDHEENTAGGDAAGPPVLNDGAPQTAPPRRGLWAFALFAAGLMLGLEFPGVPAALSLGIAAGLCAIAVVARGVLCRTALCGAMLLLGLGWMGLRTGSEPAGSLAALVGHRVSPVQVRGIISHAPRPRPKQVSDAATTQRAPVGHTGPAWTTFDLDLREIDGASGVMPASGRCRVTIGGRVELAPGEHVQVRGFFIPVEPPANPGARDDRPWARQEGRVGRISVESAALLAPWEPREIPVLDQARSMAWRGLWHARGFAADALAAALVPGGEPGDAGEHAHSDTQLRAGQSLLGALVLGQNDPALRPITGAMSRLGQVHVLSISGFHLAVMAAMALFVVRLTGERGWLEPAIVGLLVLAYLVVVPAQAPIVRSGIMVLVLLAAEATGRRYDRLNLLGWIAIALLLWRPMDLWSVGFQLSFGITGTLLWLGVLTHRRLFPPRVFGKIAEVRASRDPGMRSVAELLWGWCTGLFSTSLLCWAVAVPTVMYHVGIFSPLGAISSVVLVPIFTLALWLGFVALLLGAAWPAAAEVAGVVLGLIGDACAWLTLWLDGLPFMALSVPRVPLAWAVLATLVILGWFRLGRESRPRLLLASAVVLAWLVWILLSAGSNSGALAPGIRTRLDVLSTGDASTAIIRSSSSAHAALWLSSPEVDAGTERMLPRAARELGCWRIRTIIIGSGFTGTARDLEAASRLPELVRALDTRDVLLPGAFLEVATQESASAHARLAARIGAAGAQVRGIEHGDRLALGDTAIDLLTPQQPSGTPALAPAPATVFAEIATTSRDGPERPRVLLMGHLRRRDFEAAMDGLRERPHIRVLAAEVPRTRLRRGDDEWLRAAGAQLAWRSESPRLADQGERGPAGMSEHSTAEHGWLRLQIGSDGELILPERQ